MKMVVVRNKYQKWKGRDEPFSVSNFEATDAKV